ncbi:hypothetical protein FHY52_05610 [Nocardia nova]|uniref:Acg family FMN-binding oxidoreductase n=1 Tax=Nocardia nova TaxID=37330 RepID=UPI0025B25BA6|nr:hypothetical protein [Nocardia nova]MDN2496174.1 hypothetical protein [Nocardia nova]
MAGEESSTQTSVPDRRTILAVMHLAARAPSLHNTQPWHWVLHGSRLHLYIDPDRQLPAADPHGRQQVISCGAMLHYVRTAFAAHGWRTDTERLPDPHRPDYLAAIEFRPWPDPPADIAPRARAIDTRYTDRLPMLPPNGWNDIAANLRQLAGPYDVELDILGDDARTRLAAVDEHTDAARRDDMMYQDELNWWAGHPDTPEGIPPSALISDAEFTRVDVGRAFPSAPHSQRRAGITDQAETAVLSTYEDSRLHWLHTGEALSAILLECTAAGLATCPITHLTELPAGRRTVATLLAHAAAPQAVIRIGTAPEHQQLPPTPRRPLVDIFETCDS